MKGPEGRGYLDCSNKSSSHDLAKVARFKSYRGHLLRWTKGANPQDRPNWDWREEPAAQSGQARANRNWAGVGATCS